MKSVVEIEVEEGGRRGGGGTLRLESEVEEGEVGNIKIILIFLCCTFSK
jgi:hypothetical protein